MKVARLSVVPNSNQPEESMPWLATVVHSGALCDEIAKRIAALRTTKPKTLFIQTTVRLRAASSGMVQIKKLSAEAAAILTR